MQVKWTKEVIAILNERVRTHNESGAQEKTKLTGLKRRFAHGYNGPTEEARISAGLARVERYLTQIRHELTDVRLPLAGRQRVFPLLLTLDFRNALAEVGRLKSEPTDEALLNAARAADELAQAVLSSQLLPPIPDVRAIAANLNKVAVSCQAALVPIALYLDPHRRGLPEDLDTASLMLEIKHTQSPLITALLGAARAQHGEDRAMGALAAAILALDQLQRWAATANKAFEVGIAADKRSRSQVGVDAASRVLGFELIRSYELLTGKRATSSTTNGKPAGLLIRYLGYLFGEARGRLASTPEAAAFANSKDWKPSDETLAAWIKAYKRAA